MMFGNASIHAEDNLLDTSFELMDKGVVLSIKMKIAFLSLLDLLTTLKNS